MASIITNELKEIIADKETLKSVTTVSKAGVPHTVYKGSLHLNEDDNIEFLELLEGSINNENLVYSIWFDKVVTVNILSKDKKSYEITGKVVRNITAGSQFEKVYNALRQQRGNDADLGGIWQIEPVSVREETFAVRQAIQREELPILRHVDALLIDNKK